ncbi:peptidase M1 [Flavobacterium branchiophilum]|uniref:Aminopeptidase N n=1 Tax=Flavobacterium branchiophilum TaxID=55197 RepID=A0A543G249_9FLAO|nr:M1 family aminopeptidase [Flavobacterium branchiophilum]OXA80112.1 peptidase M1 [Flavobacterium branchiophilum] [Flavobacterium branchiophilum NBRC 15030 = ATCC 35035]TQM40151.1 putative secreted protein (Por secretion system target) [Flavobacterium branchiophilum]GEM54928.1 peptidase M1 [Flavobacterium branchiophilum NBRC 15030 = ATCC 35035]
MKYYYFLVLLLSIQGAYCQNTEESFEQLVEAEMKSAAKKQHITVNTNTANYDITYHKLEFTVNPSVLFISGKVTTTYTALTSMSSITFELSNVLTVSSVVQNGTSLGFTQNTNNELVINLATSQAAGTSRNIEINYSGTPTTTGFGSFIKSTHAGTPVLWTLSEPFGAMEWWPCKQDLNDKINSIDVYITAPSQYVAVSNGVEPEAPVVVGTQKTTHFKHQYPIPAYLIAIAVTNYSVVNQTSGTGANAFPIVNYIYPEDVASVTPQLDQTPLILDLFKNLFEIYPFHNEKYGHAQFGWGGGMEHTTVSFMVNFDRQLIAHEMAHQWFGDKITCGTWKDIWLNEGFATYLAALVYENFDGQAEFIAYKNQIIGNITAANNGAVYLTDAEATNVNRIFSSRLSYNKGAMVLEMLRWKLGDVVFFQAMKNYLADSNLAYNYAVTADFKAHLEAVYGSSLTEFFNDWIVGQGFPKYNIVGQVVSNSQMQFTVNQTSSHTSVPFFEMPLPIRVYGANGETQDLVLDHTTNGQIFTKNVNFPVIAFDFDPDRHLISKNNVTTLANSSFDISNHISIYPNPANEVLNLKMPDSFRLEKIKIYNALGQNIMESTSPKINLSGVSSGVYHIEIIGFGGVFHKNFIKK